MVDENNKIDVPSDEELCDIYLEESIEILGFLDKEIITLKNNLGVLYPLKDIRRYFHTLKGSGRMVGLIYMSEVAWLVEQTLNKWITEEKHIDQNLIDMIEVVMKSFKIWVKELSSNRKAIVNAILLLPIIEKNNSDLNITIDIGTKNNVEIKIPSFTLDDVPANISIEDNVESHKETEIIYAPINLKVNLKVDAGFIVDEKIKDIILHKEIELVNASIDSKIDTENVASIKTSKVEEVNKEKVKSSFDLNLIESTNKIEVVKNKIEVSKNKVEAVKNIKVAKVIKRNMVGSLLIILGVVMWMAILYWVIK